MEKRLEADFSRVRVYVGDAARASAAGIGARAYTVGEQMVIGDGGADRQTLAHELGHVPQQRGGVATAASFTISDPSDGYERAAEAAEAAEVQALRAPAGIRPSAPGRPHRQRPRTRAPAAECSCSARSSRIFRRVNSGSATSRRSCETRSPRRPWNSAGSRRSWNPA
jgi:hypothetical protein